MHELSFYESAWDESWKPGTRDWDAAADSWERKYREKGSRQDSGTERIEETVSFLASRGILREDASVLDAGCGPGRFAAEFAKRCSRVVGVDISPKMTAYGEAWCAESGLANTSFLTVDFSTCDVRALGLEKQFDLAFSSITPAVRGLRALDNFIACSRGWCFNASFVRKKNELYDRVRTEVFGLAPGSARGARPDWFAQLFNILWLRGYDPEVRYYDQYRAHYQPADLEMAQITAFRALETRDPSEKEILSVLRFLEEQAVPGKGVMERSHYRTGWLLWNVSGR